jgi:hypothetical protein
MKSLMLLISLLTLAACESNSSSENKKCTYNDQPVDCSPVKASDRIEPFSLTAKVTASISIFENKIDILENTEKVASKKINDSFYECSAGTTSGDSFEYKINGKNLRLKKGNEYEDLTRVSSEAKGLIGTWRSLKTDDTGSSTVTIIYTQDKMDFTVICSYK